MRVVFFGTGPVAARSLELLSSAFDIEAVITKPRPEGHTGSVPVLELCEQLNLRTLTAADRGALDKLVAEKKFESKIAVLIDFGIIVSRAVIDVFPLGIVNSHFSLLPEWRGADPITFSLLSGQKQTGISLMLIDERMDEGPLLEQRTYDIPPRITTPELTDNLISLSHQALVDILPKYASGEVHPAPQQGEPTYSRKLSKEDGHIDWLKPAEQVEREVRAYAGWPKSYASLGDGLDVVIHAAEILPDTGAPGAISADSARLVIACGEGSLRVLTIQPANKPAMDAGSFLNGYRDRLGAQAA